MTYALSSLVSYGAMDSVIWGVSVPRSMPSEPTGSSDRRIDLCSLTDIYSNDK